MVLKSVLKTSHQKRVERFMRLAGQTVPETVSIPDVETRILRAKLIMEEAMETVKAMGIRLFCDGDDSVSLNYDDLGFCESGEAADIIEVIDGCCDVIVVTTGTLSAFGVPDDPCQMEVDQSNLRKFGPGSFRRDDGKWMKPPDWRPPNIREALNRQGVQFGD